MVSLMHLCIKSQVQKSALMRTEPKAVRALLIYLAKPNKYLKKDLRLFEL